MIATVAHGKVVRLQGDPDHPVTQGFLCHRTSRFLERQYDPERITTPLLRRGDRFEPIPWDEALDLAAQKIRQIKAESGAAAILNYRSGGSLGLMKHVNDYIWERIGPVAIKTGDVCSGAGDAAQMEDFGAEDSNDFFDLHNARTIVLWGKNVYVSSVHLLPILREVRKNGTKIILIDPVRHRTVDLCDQYLQPRPGGDTALALGVARWLFENEKTDPAAATYCDHLDEFQALAFSKPIEEWAALADVHVEELKQLAATYGNGPSAILVGWGMQRRLRGYETVRVIDALGAISGNLGVPGGGVSFYYKRRAAFDTSFVKGAEAAPRTIVEPLLGQGILEASDPPIRMVWVTAGNPVAMLPESETVAQALSSREFTVVVDNFLTDTARCAHLVLPTTTMLEDDDLVGAYGHHWLAELRPVVPPPPGVRTDYWILRELARRLGVAPDLPENVDDWKRRLLAPVARLGASLEAIREAPVRNPKAPLVLHADRRFHTPSGKVNLIRSVEPVPFLPPEDRPLLLMAISTDRAQASQWLPQLQEGPASVTVHPSRGNGFQEGDLVRVESELGSLVVRLRIDERQRPDVLLMDKGGWRQAGRCANTISPARLTDAGGGAAYYDTPVRLLPLSE